MEKETAARERHDHAERPWQDSAERFVAVVKQVIPVDGIPISPKIAKGTRPKGEGQHPLEQNGRFVAIAEPKLDELGERKPSLDRHWGSSPFHASRGIRARWSR